MNTIQIRSFIRQIITEAKAEKAKKSKNKMATSSVSNRLKMIDEAGDKAALQAKITEIEKDIKTAHDIKSAIPADIKDFVTPQRVSDLMDEMDKSIEELEAKKAELEAQMADMNKPVKEGAKKKVDEKLKPSMGAGAYVKDFEKSKAPQFKGKSKEKKDKMAVAAYLTAKDKK